MEEAPHTEPQVTLPAPRQSSSSRRSSAADGSTTPGRASSSKARNKRSSSSSFSSTSSETKFPETNRRNKTRKRPRTDALTKREDYGILFEQEQNNSGAYTHHANILHSVGRGASLFYDMFGTAAATAVLLKDKVKEKKQIEEKRGFMQLEEILIPALPKARKSLPLELGSHTLFLHRDLSGVQPPMEMRTAEALAEGTGKTVRDKIDILNINNKNQ